MLVSKHASQGLFPISIEATAKKALDLLGSFNFSHFPITENNSFVGNLRVELLSEMNPYDKLESIRNDFEFFYVKENGTLFEAMQIMNINEADFVPVLDSNNLYTSYLGHKEILSALSVMPFISEPGLIMIVEIGQKQFSPNEITRITESNDVKISGLFIINYIDDRVQFAIKLSDGNLASVGETFERFGYTIIHKFFSDNKQELLKSRYDHLMKYLEI